MEVRKRAVWFEFTNSFKYPYYRECYTLSDISLYTSCLIFRDGIFYSPSDKMMISIPTDHTKRQRKIQQRCIGGATPALRRKVKIIVYLEARRVLKSNMGFEKI